MILQKCNELSSSNSLRQENICMNFSRKYYRYSGGGDANYYCKICEAEGGAMMTSSEIKMIKHIQSDHQDLHLVVNIGPGYPGCEELGEKLVENSVKETELDVNRNSDNNNIPFSQEVTFYPCDHGDCSDIFLSLRALTKHKLSHKEREEASQIKVKKKKKPSNIKIKVHNKHREKRIVPEYKCPICPSVYLNTKGNASHSIFKHHVLSHFYKTFYSLLPSSRPYKCPMCQQVSRDKVCMTRHYAYGHQKIYEITDVTPQDLYYI